MVPYNMEFFPRKIIFVFLILLLLCFSPSLNNTYASPTTSTKDRRSLSDMMIAMINLFTGKPAVPESSSSGSRNGFIIIRRKRSLVKNLFAAGLHRISTTGPNGTNGTGSGGGRPLPSAAQCAQKCTAHMRRCAQNEIPGFEKQIWSFEYDPSKLETYCRIHENGTECLNTCPEGVAKSLADNGLNIGRRICNESAIRRNARCITDAVGPLQTVCQTQSQCGQYPFPARQDRPNSVAEFQQLMRQTCLRLKCNLECAASAITDRCGHSAERDVQLVVLTAVEYLKRLTDAIKVPDAYAIECDLLENLGLNNTHHQQQLDNNNDHKVNNNNTINNSSSLGGAAISSFD